MIITLTRSVARQNDQTYELFLSLAKENQNWISFKWSTLSALWLAKVWPDAARCLRVAGIIPSPYAVGADLSGQNLSCARLDEGIFRSANMKGAILTGSNMSYGNFQMSDLSDADTRHCIFTHSNFYGAKMERVKATSAFFNGSNLCSARLAGGNFTNASMLYCNFSRADLDGTNLTNTYLHEACFHEAYYPRGPLPAGWQRDSVGYLYMANRHPLPERFTEPAAEAITSNASAPQGVTWDTSVMQVDFNVFYTAFTRRTPR